jgi:type IV pilus assembly protein PilA
VDLAWNHHSSVARGTEAHGRLRGFTLIELMLVVSLVGVLAALALVSLGKYMHAAKTSEAKQTLGGISRAIALLYDRSAKSQLLTPGALSDPANLYWCPECGASKVCVAPGFIPAAKKYNPDNSGGKDFDACCWRCIRFGVDSPTYFQYRYSVGQSYVGPAVGGPDPGATGIEVAAMGDLDGDTSSSTMTITGREDPQTNTLSFSTQIFAYDENE